MNQRYKELTETKFKFGVKEIVLNSKVEVNVIYIKQKIVFIALQIEQDIFRKRIYYVENTVFLDSLMVLETETEVSILPNMEKR